MKNVWMGLFLIAGMGQQLRADEGMWIPLLIEKYHIEDMQAAGLKLSAEDIYSINQACLKDAIVLFGRGCTGELISGEGLLLTNHHCGEGAIHSHSTVKNNYLENGFWAMSREEELPNPGLSVQFLRYMEDVTVKVMGILEPGMDPEARETAIRMAMGSIIREATEGRDLRAEVKPFYYGNAYYLFVYESYQDVRLVGAPPSSIGNFGADTDNWVWPRHTGDFSLFRIYAGEDNKPAEYSPGNKPYAPKKHLEVNLGGIEEGDYTMVLGYPARTSQYLYSEAVRQMVETSLPLKVGLRTTRLEIIDKYSADSYVVRLQYAHKYRRISNAWKKWQGMIQGLELNRAVEQKLQEEAVFRAWVMEDPQRRMKYDRLLDDFAELYEKKAAYMVATDLWDEAVWAVEAFRQIMSVRNMQVRGGTIEENQAMIDQFFKDFHAPLDMETFGAMMEAYRGNMPENHHPAFFADVDRKYKGDFVAYAEKIYSKSVITDPGRMAAFLQKNVQDGSRAYEILRKDPLVECLQQFNEIYYTWIRPEYHEITIQEEKLYKSYMAGLLEQSSERDLYPDANGTMRLTYGKVEGYQPMDGVHYTHSTTLKGLMEKGKMGLVDYQVPDRLVELYENRDFGEYGVNGTMPVCFVASNHTSGGNSGSPVLDAEGRLIGLNFDREWEGVMSDVYYDPDLSRNIAVDIRYVMFLIDKYAGAGYLLEEMDIIR